MIEKTLHTGKVVINYAEAGAENQSPDIRPAVVLLHGGSARWQYLEQLVQDLSRSWHVYAPDLRGHGKSGRVAWGYTLRDYAEDIAAFLQQVSGPAFLYGHSLGGIVALMIAGFYPENVRAVLVGDSPLDSKRWKMHMQGPQRGMVQSWRALSGGSYSIEEIIAGLKDSPMGMTESEQEQPLRMIDVYPAGHGIYQHLAERLYQHDPDVLGMLLDDFEHAAAGFEMETLYPAIRCPVLLMQADPSAGGVMTDGEVADALPFLSQPCHVRFKGLSHLLNIEDPQGVTRAIQDFLNQCSRL